MLIRHRVINVLVLVLLFGLVVIIVGANSFQLPSVYGTGGRYVEPPLTYLLALAPLSWGMVLTLKIFFPKMEKMFGVYLFWGGIGIAFLAYLIL